MKKIFLSTAAIALSMLFCAMPNEAYALDETSEELDTGVPMSDYSGYYLWDATESVGFHSFDDFVNYRAKAYDRIKGSDASGEVYLSDYDYIYIPTSMADAVDKITDINITPLKCTVTFSVNGKETKVTFYYSDKDNYSKPSLTGTKTSVNGTDYYLHQEYLSEPTYNFMYNGKYFSFSSSVSLDDNNGIPITKYYVNSHFQEENGKLYYISNGKKKSGWHSIGNHKYYFRSSDKSAICGKKAKIGGILYKFDDNGVCTGKFTGYAKVNGKKVYFKDGVATEK